MTIESKNRRVGIFLVMLTLGITVYSFIVIKTRGQISPLSGQSKLSKIADGL